MTPVTSQVFRRKYVPAERSIAPSWSGESKCSRLPLTQPNEDRTRQDAKTETEHIPALNKTLYHRRRRKRTSTRTPANPVARMASGAGRIRIDVKFAAVAMLK